MTKNIISFPEEYKVDEICQQAVDQTPLAHKQFVQEVLAQQAAEKAACENDANDADDFELQRMIGTFKLLRSKGYTLRILPGTPEENAPVFDFAAERIQPAA